MSLSSLAFACHIDVRFPAVQLGTDPVSAINDGWSFLQAIRGLIPPLDSSFYTYIILGFMRLVKNYFELCLKKFICLLISLLSILCIIQSVFKSVKNNLSPSFIKLTPTNSRGPLAKPIHFAANLAKTQEISLDPAKALKTPPKRAKCQKYTSQPAVGAGLSFST